MSIAYNAFFTSWHILFVLGFDRDVPDEVALQHPSLYKIGTSNKLFNAWAPWEMPVVGSFRGVSSARFSAGADAD